MEKPMLFSTPMVQAIKESVKTVTRRIIKNLPSFVHALSINSLGDLVIEKWPKSDRMMQNYGRCENAKVPYKVGDILWVRETYRKYNPADGFGDIDYETDVIEYAADNPEPVLMVDGDGCIAVGSKGQEIYLPYKPSIHMPKELARIWLQVTSVSVERLHDITEEDAMAEGCKWTDNGPKPWASHLSFEEAKKVAGWKSGYSHTGETHPDRCLPTARGSFGNLWESINGRNGWNINPWVWVIRFKVLSINGKPDALDA